MIIFFVVYKNAPKTVSILNSMHLKEEIGINLSSKMEKKRDFFGP